MRKTPNVVSGTGALAAAATERVATTLNELTTDLDRATAGAQREVGRVVNRVQAAPQRATSYIRKIPKAVSGIGALSAAEMPSAITLRVSTGSTIPSSQRRAVE